MLHNGVMLSARLMAVHRTVVAEGSLTRAALVLGYTVSAVSQQLALLETQAGTELFEKAGRGVRPTAAGVLLAEHANRILHQIEEAEAALAEQAQVALRVSVTIESATTGLQRVRDAFEAIANREAQLEGTAGHHLVDARSAQRGRS